MILHIYAKIETRNIEQSMNTPLYHFTRVALVVVNEVFSLKALGFILKNEKKNHENKVQIC